MPLPELIERINRVTLSFLPSTGGPGSGAGRVRPTFTDRSFRHYQTLGCIDPPKKDGRWAIYGPRHFAQALLVRRLLWERVPSEQIARFVAGRSLPDTERMFLEGVQFVGQVGQESGRKLIKTRAKVDRRTLQDTSESTVTDWIRVEFAPGIELHVVDPPPNITPEQRRRMQDRIGQVLRQVLR